MNGRHANFRSALNGSLAREVQLFNGWPGNKQNRLNVLKHEPIFRQGFRPKNNWNVQYIYRGLHVNPNKINKMMGYSSWTTRKKIAENFGGGGLGNGSILRINTKLLKNIPVRTLSTEGESEVVLPPMTLFFNKNSINRTNAAKLPVIPVNDVSVNARFVKTPNVKTFIPRMAARRIAPPTPMNRLRRFFRRN
jgi:hypothetical protein